MERIRLANRYLKGSDPTVKSNSSTFLSIASSRRNLISTSPGDRDANRTSKVGLYQMKRRRYSNPKWKASGAPLNSTTSNRSQPRAKISRTSSLQQSRWAGSKNRLGEAVRAQRDLCCSKKISRYPKISSSLAHRWKRSSPDLRKKAVCLFRLDLF